MGGSHRAERDTGKFTRGVGLRPARYQSGMETRRGVSLEHPASCLGLSRPRMLLLLPSAHYNNDNAIKRAAVYAVLSEPLTTPCTRGVTCPCDSWEAEVQKN